MEEEEKKKKYTAGREVQDAEDALAIQSSTRPGAYTSLWEAQLQSAMDRILNRQDFDYRLNGDALYRQYRDANLRDGRNAMLDAMGTAAALTGGYSNSYAETAGQQAYNAHLEKLNDRIPELYNLALSRYRDEGERMMADYEMLLNADRRDYERYQDRVSDWQRDYDTLNSIYTDRRDFDYGIYRDTVADEQWAAEFEEDLRRFELEWAAKHPASSGGGGGGGGGSAAKKLSYDEILSKAVSMAKSGQSWNSINSYIAGAVNSGTITQKQSATIAGKALDAKPKSR